jgi:prepilin-type N-terminal cleavage/methylation domain-containing protein
MNSKKAFTLIELLVVIAIIAILAAILFPVFAQAKAAAKKTQTLSNAKQTTLGTQMYLNDSDDTYPMGSGCGWYYPTDGGWSWDTQPYMKNVPILRDATDSLAGTFMPTWADPTVAVKISMVSNGFMAYNNSSAAWEVFGISGMNQGKAQAITARCGGPWMGKTITNESDVTQPASSIAYSTRYGGDNIYGEGDMVSGVNWWDYTGAGLIPDATRDGTVAYQAPASNGSTYTVNKDQRYGAVVLQGGNVGIFTFTDGHAKAMNPLQTDPDPANQPQNNLWNVRR